MILTYPNATFHIITGLDINEVVMTIHRMTHRISSYETVIVNIERFPNEDTRINNYTIVILTSRKHLTAKEISILFSGIKKKKKEKNIYGK